jgi:hypothetical protein
MPEFEEELISEHRLPVEEFAKKFSGFFMKQWKSRMPSDYEDEPMVFLVGGYDEDAPYGKLFGLSIPNKPEPEELNRDTFGIIWGGQREISDRLVQGFDDGLVNVLQRTYSLTEPQKTALKENLKAQLSLKIPYQFLPLQDCVDLAIFLIGTTIVAQTFLVGVRGVGGAIDVATITRTDGFMPVQVKSIMGARRQVFRKRIAHSRDGE